MPAGLEQSIKAPGPLGVQHGALASHNHTLEEADTAMAFKGLGQRRHLPHYHSKAVDIGLLVIVVVDSHLRGHVSHTTLTACQYFSCSLGRVLGKALGQTEIKQLFWQTNKQ